MGQRQQELRRVKSRKRSRKLAPMDYLFVLTAIVSAVLFFVLAPMFAKMALPLLGGAPAVWTTCLVFCQACLLVGYLYAHWSLKWLGPRRQPVMHLALMCLPWLALPVGVAQGWAPSPNGFPVFGLWLLMAVSVGLPLLAVSASAPLLQAWLGRTTSPSARDPYYLYAASNLGSLLAVVCYPAIHWQWSLGEQAWAWAGGYGLLMILMAGCAIQLWRSPAAVPPVEQVIASEKKKKNGERLTLRRRLYWVALALVPSSLLMGVTTLISTDVAQIPLLWGVPLALYLLTLVVVFARRSAIRPSWPMRAEPFLIVAAIAVLAWRPVGLIPLMATGLLQLATFYVVALACHGQLAADRPSRRHLTEFYLWLSLGGVLGGLLNVLAAPLVFSVAMEYPLMLAAACLLRRWLPPCGVRTTAREIAIPVAILVVCCGLVGTMFSRSALLEWRYTDIPLMKLAVVALAAVAAYSLRQRPIRLTVAVMTLLAICLSYPQGKMRTLCAERSFFGVSQVMAQPSWNAHVLDHGAMVQGSQSRDRKLRREPWAYYSRTGPLGQIFQTLRGRRPLAEIGVVGLGAGTIAAYGQPGERITFYEIDPAVERIARDPTYFTYLDDSQAKVEVVLGDARRSLEEGPARKFDLLVLDAFNSDFVPTHLLTREAMKVYCDRLAEHGLLAIHLPGRCFDLAPLLGRLAADRDIDLVAMASSDKGMDSALDRFGSTWVVMARRPDDLASLAGNAAWKPLTNDGGRVWTDDHANVVGALAWSVPGDSLEFSSLWRPDQSEASFHGSTGAALYEQKRYGEALAHFEKALELAPDNAAYHNSLGLVLQQQGKINEAIDQFRQSLELKPDDSEVYGNLGLALLSQGKADEAVAFLRRATELNPNDARAHHDLAGVFANYGKVAEAVPHFQKALEISPNFAEAHNNLGCILGTAGQTDAAIAHFRRALELKPDYADAETNLANLLAANGHTADAIERYRKSLKIRPAHVETHYRLARLLQDRGELDDAVKHYGLALKLDPDQPEIYGNLGHALQMQGKIDAAIANYRKALELTPDDAKAHCNLGLGLESQGRFADAAAEYEKALKLAPDYLLAVNNLAWLRAVCSDPSVRNGEQAVQLANRALDLADANDPSLLDTLAAAYAEAGRFAEAVDTAKTALRRASERDDESLVEAIEKKIALYKAKTPFHETAGRSDKP